MLGSTVFAASCGFGLLLLANRGFQAVGGVRGRTAVWLCLAGAAVALPVLLLSSYLIDTLGWSTHGNSVHGAVTNAAPLALTALLEQCALVVVLWPTYRAHRLERLGTSISAAVTAATGFGIIHSLTSAATTSSVPVLVSVFYALATRAFSAGLWACCLSASHVRYRNWFPLAWLVGVGIDGAMRHLQQGCGRVGQVAAALLLVVTLIVFGAFRQRMLGDRESVTFSRPSRLAILVDSPRIGTMRAAWQHAHRPALLHWIVGGAFVSFGANIAGFAVGVSVAHALGIDLSRVNETEVGAMAPLAILAAAVLASYPLAGFLTAKASDADSVFEPGVAALISISALTILLSMTAPVTMVLGLVLAPVAFGLACLGAWLGLTPHDDHRVS